MKKPSPLLLKDDYWAIWIGAFLLIVSLFLFIQQTPPEFEEKFTNLDHIMELQNERAPFKTIAWHLALQQQEKLKASSTPFGKWVQKLTGKTMSWSSNPLDAFFISEKKAAAKKAKASKKLEAVVALENTKKAEARLLEKVAEENNYKDATHNNITTIAIQEWLTAHDELENAQKSFKKSYASPLPWLIGLGIFFILIFIPGIYYMKKNIPAFVKGFGFVFLIAIVSYFLAAQVNMKAIGFGYAAWAILFGLLISNTVGTPEWVKPALMTEWFIKTGLVLLGAEVLLNKILAIGLPGIFVAWVVTPIVLVSTYIFGQKVLKIQSKTLNMTISADMSVCGVSAAVATAAACNAKKEELTLAIGLSMMFTSVMMIVLPLIINGLGMPEVLGGAWIGGTIDATGAVVAAGEFLGDKALSVAATIKMIQNILIGIIAFGVAIYFTTKVNPSETSKVGFSEVWKRFPKFILGFLGASIFFSLLYAGMGDNHAYTIIDHGVIRGFSKNVRGWLFCLAFVSIGLSTNFKELKKHFVGGKPLILYLCGQTFNLLLTLLMAYIMFYLIFPEITENI